MKINKTSLLILIVLIIACAFYRVWNNRPGGFAPQIAMALFAGSVIKDKRFSFLFPLLSMLVSDAIYQVLYVNGMTNIQGFYHGQWLNYLLIGLVTVIGFFINQKKIPSIFIGSLAGVAFYFIVSNFFTWTTGLIIINRPFPKTFD